MPAQHVHNFSLLAGVLKGFTARASIGFSFNQLFFQGKLARSQHGTAENVKLQLCRTNPGFALRASPYLNIFHLTVYVFDLLPQHRNPVIGFLQPQLLLTFQALPQPQKHFERKSKSHKGQLARDSSRLMLSSRLVCSSAPCCKKRFSSGKITSALSSNGSLPF